jgi:hypothetical protein
MIRLAISFVARRYIPITAVIALAGAAFLVARRMDKSKKNEITLKRIEAETKRELRLRRALTIRTENSVYLIGEAAESGIRTLQRQDDDTTKKGRLLFARVGQRFLFQTIPGIDIVSSNVVSIEPDPDVETV